MNERLPILTVPVEDRAGLVTALRDALSGGIPVLPVTGGAGEGLEALPLATALVIRTSGSSGVQKAVALSAPALTSSADATHERLGGPGQWLVALPTQLISGAQMLVRSVVAGTVPVYATAARASFEPAEFFAAAATMTHERRYVSLVPVQLTRLMDCVEHRSAERELATLRRFDAILVGGQAVTVALRSRAHRLGLSLHRSYGMTETAGGCVYDGVPIGDTRVRIRRGEVQLAGPTLALGYVGDGPLTRSHFCYEDGIRWYATGDAGELLGGMLTVTGRLDRVIVSGGVNVSLDEIERVAGEMPGWSGVVAAAIADPEWGERPVLVRAIDVAHPAIDGITFAAVRERIREALGAPAAPDRVLELDEIPSLPGGKPNHLAISARLRSGGAQ
jgi:O-succinylbenzoic acid--CoA ligase